MWSNSSRTGDVRFGRIKSNSLRISKKRSRSRGNGLPVTTLPQTKTRARDPVDLARRTISHSRAINVWRREVLCPKHRSNSFHCILYTPGGKSPCASKGGSVDSAIAQTFRSLTRCFKVPPGGRAPPGGLKAERAGETGFAVWILILEHCILNVQFP